MLDPRGPRFAAAVTTVVVVVILVTGSGWLALVQAAVFALGAADPRYHPYGLVYKWLIRPRLAPPAELEQAAPVRFAQGVGLAFMLARFFLAIRSWRSSVAVAGPTWRLNPRNRSR